MPRAETLDVDIEHFANTNLIVAVAKCLAVTKCLYLGFVGPDRTFMFLVLTYILYVTFHIIKIE